MFMHDHAIFYNTLPNVVSNYMYHDIEFITGGFCITSRSYCACIKLNIHFLRHEKHFNLLLANIPQRGSDNGIVCEIDLVQTMSMYGKT